jgi:hypothetical protein
MASYALDRCIHHIYIDILESNVYVISLLKKMMTTIMLNDLAFVIIPTTIMLMDEKLDVDKIKISLT